MIRANKHLLVAATLYDGMGSMRANIVKPSDNIVLALNKEDFLFANDGTMKITWIWDLAFMANILPISIKYGFKFFLKEILREVAVGIE